MVMAIQGSLCTMLQRYYEQQEASVAPDQGTYPEWSFPISSSAKMHIT
jgi:hypothetical protein